MATNTQKKRNIRYLNRDFDSFKKDIIEHLRIYFPDTVEDFNESSVGMMLTEKLAFIGDNLSFYLDKKFNESFIQTAKEKKNVFKHGKQQGYKAFGKSPAVGKIDGYLRVPATASNGQIIPDMRYAMTISKGANCRSNNGESYETLLEIDFSTVDITDSNFVQVSTRAPDNTPTSFVLRVPDIDLIAGETKNSDFSVGAYESFKSITIPEDDVIEVISVTDSEGNSWYEVDFLAQDTVFDGVANSGQDSSDVPYLLTLRSVPYRFVTEYNIETNRTSIKFGSGDAYTFDGDLIPDLGDLALPLYGRDTFTDFALDPQNFLKTRTLGLAPVNTTLTVNYRVGGGASSNAGAGEVNIVTESEYEIGDTTLDEVVIRDVASSFAVYNRKPISGGRDEFAIEEIKELISANYASQSRIVTDADFIARALSMPVRFGSVFRAGVRKGIVNKNSVEMFILSKDSNGNLTTAPSALKENLKLYLSKFRMMTDAIEILDGDIINIGVNFSILVDPSFNKTEVLVNCISALKEFFEIDKWQFNQPINITDIYSIIKDVAGVLSLIDVDFQNRNNTYQNRTYSSTIYNASENKKNGIVYCNENAIFEIKYPNKDITGLAK